MFPAVVSRKYTKLLNKIGFLLIRLLVPLLNSSFSCKAEARVQEKDNEVILNAKKWNAGTLTTWSWRSPVSRRTRRGREVVRCNAGLAKC